MHFNENLHCEAREKKDGSKCSQVTYPKLKLGESVARDVACAPTYGNFQNAISNYKAGFGRYFQVNWGETLLNVYSIEKILSQYVKYI